MAAPPGYHEQFLRHGPLTLGSLGFHLDIIQGLPERADFEHYLVTADGMSAKLAYNAQYGLVHAEELSRIGQRAKAPENTVRASSAWHMENLVGAFVQNRVLNHMIISNVAEKDHGTRRYLKANYSDEQSHLVQANTDEFTTLVQERGTLGFFANVIPAHTLESIYIIVRVNNPKLVFNYVPTTLVPQAPPTYPPTQPQQTHTETPENLQEKNGCCDGCIIQ